MMTIESIRQFCLSLPGAAEDIKYGTDLCFTISKKIFLGTRIEGPFRTGIKCTEAVFAALTEREGIVPMPRLSAAYWIRIEKVNALSKKEWHLYITASYRLIVSSLPKKKQQQPGLRPVPKAINARIKQ
jgi:predicted DNA-binding protein (MmcQ/YjbR family)